MALFVSVLGLSGLAVFALLGFIMEITKMVIKSMRTRCILRDANMLGNSRFNYFKGEDKLITKILEIKMMLLLGLALIFLVFVVWLVFTAFTLEDPALTMHQDDNWYEDEDEDEANEDRQ